MKDETKENERRVLSRSSLLQGGKQQDQHADGRAHEAQILHAQASKPRHHPQRGRFDVTHAKAAFDQDRLEGAEILERDVANDERLFQIWRNHGSSTPRCVASCNVPVPLRRLRERQAREDDGA